MWLDAQHDGGDRAARWLPEAEVRTQLELWGVWFVAAVGAHAAHPALEPGGDLTTHARLAIELR